MPKFNILAHRTSTRKDNTRHMWCINDSDVIHYQTTADTILEALQHATETFNTTDQEYTVVSVEEARPEMPEFSDEELTKALSIDSQLDEPEEYEGFSFNEADNDTTTSVIQDIVIALNAKNIIPGLSINVIEDESNYYATLEIYRNGSEIYLSQFIDMNQFTYITDDGWDAILAAARIVIDTSRKLV